MTGRIHWRSQTVYALLVGLVLAPLSIRAVAVADVPYRSCFEIASKLHGVPMDLLLAVAAVESALDPDARSHANAHGIMQIQWPGTARHLGVTRVSELYNPCLNIELGARYLSELLTASDGNVERALAAYNYGPGRIGKQKALPAGAVAYAARVTQHQSKLRSASARTGRKYADAPGLAFDSRIRADRFARTLNTRIDGARFHRVDLPSGGHRVEMRISEEGLTTADVATLQALGWEDLGGAP